MEKTEVTVKREQAFVQFVLGRLRKDSAYGAALRRADNPATEYQAWEYLSRWCDIDKSWELQPFATVGAALARAKPLTDGPMGIGAAIASCYTEGGTPGNKNDTAKAKLRRLLSCDTVEETCKILRPLLSLISSRGIPLSYSDLLSDLTHFSELKKQKWAVDFYGRRHQSDDSIDL